MVERARLHQLLAFAALVVLLLVFMFMIFGRPANWAQFFVDRQIRPGLFIVLMLLLPLAGFPISAFLLAVGIKFGPYEGFAITSVIIGVHLIVTFLLTHSLLRPYLLKMMAQTRYELPQIHTHRQLVFAMIFMAIPALPYTVKIFPWPCSMSPGAFICQSPGGPTCCLPFLLSAWDIRPSPTPGLPGYSLLYWGSATCWLLKCCENTARTRPAAKIKNLFPVDNSSASGQ